MDISQPAYRKEGIMQKALLIAEKPSLRRTIEDVYDRHKKEIPYRITFKEQRGHLLTLKLPSEIDENMKIWSWDHLPFDPAEHGGWKYKIIPEKKEGHFLTAKERYMDIKETLESGDFDFVINAGDPDQEGELLVQLVLRSLKNKLPVKRFWTNDLTETNVLNALKNLRDDDHDPQLLNLLSAAYARQRSDYRVGMNLSEACSLKMGSRVAVGRVKTPIQAIVCRREKEIEDFKPTTTYGVRADYTEGFSGQLYEKPSDSDDDDKEDEKAGLVYFDDKEDATPFAEMIKGIEDGSLSAPLGHKAEVISFEKKQVKTLPPKLFKLATVQIAAGKLGYTSQNTLRIIQELYEKKYVSYPRTDCEYLSSHEDFSAMLESASAVDELAPYVKGITVSDIGRVQHTKKWVNDARLEESGHSALVPTTIKPDMDSLSYDEKVIYSLIAKQFVAAFLPPLIQDKTDLIAEADGCQFRSGGKTLVDAGYTKIFGTKFTDTEIPEYNKGDLLTVNKYSFVEKTSQCPKRFTDADLISVCENPAKFLDDKSLKSLGKELKIGTPATRSGIIEQLIAKDHYLERKKEGKVEKIVPTKAGMEIYENLKDFEISKVDMTGHWEIQLEEIREGKLSLRSMEEGMKKDVAQMIEHIRDAEMTGVSQISQKKERRIIGKCPECGGDLISSEKGFYCSNYKEGCKVGAFKKICDSTITDAEFLNLLSGKEITKEIKKTKESGTVKWRQKLKYDKAEHKIAFVEAADEETDLICPSCGKHLIEAGPSLKCSCGFSMYCYPCGKTLTKAQIKDIISGEKVLVKGMKSKKGKKFDAYLKLNPEKKGVDFQFPERKR